MKPSMSNTETAPVVIPTTTPNPTQDPSKINIEKPVVDPRPKA